MSPSAKKQTAFRIDADVLDGLKAIKERDGVPVSEQVRRALSAWVESRGVTKADRKRVGARKRP
ncbi:MAG: ribbon-helix-helix protein, CopG family [Acidobacteria bacterium]|nr:ribbon-helix-helix protein, CopG family [Acidobacteriota bacterium]